MLIKLLLLAAIAFGVWHFWRRFVGVPGRESGGPGKPRRGTSAARIEDMAQCPACQIYVAASAPACGRQDCPRRG
jgi:hypothetical protein